MGGHIVHKPKADPDPSSITLLDPEDVRVGRVDGDLFNDGIDRIRQEYTVQFDGGKVPVVIYSRVDDFHSYVVALLNALGFPDGDLEYVAQRLIKEATDAATQQQTDDA